MFDESKAAATISWSIIDNNKSGFKSGQIASKIQENYHEKKNLLIVLKVYVCLQKI